MATITSTDNKLRFLSGVSSKLSELSVQLGNVYVTTDEHIMYADLPDAQGNAKRYRLSDIVMVDTLANLPTYPPEERATALYYVRSDNILCCYNTNHESNGAAGKWTQINALPTLDSIVASSKVECTAIADGAQAAFILEDNAGNNVTQNFRLNVVGDGAAQVTASADKSKIVVSAADTITSSALSTATETANTSVKINLTETTTGFNADGSAKTASSTTDSIILHNNGGVKITQANDTINFEASPQRITYSFNESGAFGSTVLMADGSEVESLTVTPIIKYGVGSVKSTAYFNNGTATLSDVYTKSEVDQAITDQLEAANAMVFKGEVSDTINLPYYDTSEVSVGDTYIVSGAGTIKDANAKTIKTNAKVGDLFIANSSTTETDGKIVADIEWVYVPAGNDDLYTYSSAVSDSSFAIVENFANEDPKTIGSVLVGAGLKGTSSGSALTIAHPTKTVGTTTPSVDVNGSSQTITFTAISAITYDEYGHVASVATSTYSIQNWAIDSLVYSASATGNIATISNTIKQKSGVEETASFTVQSNNLNVTASGSAVTIDLVWGQFA